jgi:hypothetical protein
MRSVVLILGFVLFFSSCEKQAMEDVYQDSFPEDKYPACLPQSNGIWSAGGTIKATNIPLLVGNTNTGLFQLAFIRDMYYSSSSYSFQLESVFSISKYIKRQEGIGGYTQVESATYTFICCKPNIYKIEKVSKMNVIQHNSKWDDDIMGYWVIYSVRDKTGKTVNMRMSSLDQKKYIDL